MFRITTFLSIGLILVSVSLANSQGLANQSFQNFSCTGAYGGDHFYRLNQCGLQPWRVSHGSPDIESTFSQIPIDHAATIAGGSNFAEPGQEWGSEGIFQNYNFYRGNRYYLRAYVRVNTVNRPDANTVEKVFMALASGLAARTNNPNAPVGQQDASYNFPSPSKKQEVWNEQNYQSRGWVLIDREFIPNSDYSQFWISLIDKEYSGIQLSAANMKFTFLNVSCCPYDFTVGSSTNLSSVPTATNVLRTDGTVTVASGKSASFKAEREVVLKPGFTAANGSSFTAAIDDCNCSPGGGNVVNICNQFSGSVNFITSSNGTGVYVPNIFVRNGSNYWYPTSYGYSKPYNAYHWKLEVFNRTGKKVDELEKTSGVDGFANRSIRWNAKGLSTGVYNITLKLTNCSGTYTFKDQVQVSNASSRIAASDKEKLHLPDEYVFRNESIITSNTLYPASPNPSVGKTTIGYAIADASYVSLKLLNAMGVEIRTLVNEEIHEIGTFKVSLDTYNLPSGIYLYELRTNQGGETKQLIVQ